MSCEFCEIFKNGSFIEHPWTTASVFLVFEYNGKITVVQTTLTMLKGVGYKGSRSEYVKRQRKQVMIFIVAALILAIVAFVIGFYAWPKSGCDGSTKKGDNILKRTGVNENEKLHKSMVAELVARNIEKNLK